MGTNCTPLLADFFLYCHEYEFWAKVIEDDKRKLARKLNLSYCYAGITLTDKYPPRHPRLLQAFLCLGMELSIWVLPRGGDFVRNPDHQFIVKWLKTSKSHHINILSYKKDGNCRKQCCMLKNYKRSLKLCPEVGILSKNFVSRVEFLNEKFSGPRVGPVVGYWSRWYLHNIDDLISLYNKSGQMHQTFSLNIAELFSGNISLWTQ